MRDSEISSRLDKILIYKELKMRCEEDVSLASVLALVHSIGEDAIILNMPEYTLHDENHIYNMLYLAGKIIPQNVMSNLSTPDLMMIILSVFLHDIGMSPNKELVQAWKGQLENRDISSKWRRFQSTINRRSNYNELYKNYTCRTCQKNDCRTVGGKNKIFRYRSNGGFSGNMF